MPDVIDGTDQTPTAAAVDTIARRPTSGPGTATMRTGHGLCPPKRR
jgi:hypothetical protein